MDKAFYGYARYGYARYNVYRPVWGRLKQGFKHLGSLNVTRRKLKLGSRDSTTGWYAKSYEESTIEMPIVPRGSSRSLLPAGSYVRTDALGFAVDPVVEGDEIETSSNEYWSVEAVREFFVVGGDSFSHREVDLSFLPFKNLRGDSYTASSVEDPRYRTKYWLEKYLATASLPRYIVAYGEPDYPVTRVFKDKRVDVAFSVSTPNSTPLKGHHRYVTHYEEHVPITIQCIDKNNLDGAQLRWQAETELRRVAEEYPLGSLRNFERAGRPYRKDLGGTILHGVEYSLVYVRDRT